MDDREPLPARSGAAWERERKEVAQRLSRLSALGAGTAYVLPKRGRARFGPEWSRVYRRILEDPYECLKECYKRNLRETMRASDKGRFGRTVRQRREGRQEMAMAGIAILHNMFTTRVPR